MKCKSQEQKQRFSIKKLSIGVVSLLVGLCYLGAGQTVSADSLPASLEVLTEEVVPDPVDSREVPVQLEDRETEKAESLSDSPSLVDEKTIEEGREVPGPVVSESVTVKVEGDGTPKLERLTAEEARDVETKQFQEEPLSRFIVQFQEEERSAIMEQVKAITGSRVLHEYSELLTGASIEIPDSEADRLKEISGISSIEESRRIKQSLHTAKEVIHALKESPKYQQDGRGMVIAVIDSGIDTKHKDMRLDEGVIPKIKEIKESVENTYTTKVPHGYNYVLGNDDLYDDTHEPHGMHIAGTLAGNATDEEISLMKGVDGIAPNAQILAYKIFSNDPKHRKPEREDTAYAAIEDAVKHGADVISLSLGYYDSGLPGNAYYTIAKRAAERGIVITAAIGNAGTSSSDTSFDLHTNNALGMTDTATTVGVAATPWVIGVGSVRNTHLVQEEASIDGQTYGYFPVGDSKLVDGEYEFVDGRHGRPEELVGLELAGKVVVITKEDTNLKDIIRSLKERDIAGVVVINADLGWNKDYYRTHQWQVHDKTILSYSKIWGIGLNGEDGQKLLEGLPSKPKMMVTKSDKPGLRKVTSLPTVSGFSSWGPSVSLELKPEIVAPGEDIYATINNNSYGSMSGTSMASPIVAGVSTLLLPKVRTMHHPQGLSTVNLLRMILMNTAQPLVDRLDEEEKPLEYSPRQQGAGLIKVDRAFQTDVLVHHGQKGGAELKEIGKETSFEITVENIGKQTRSFRLETGKVLTSQDVPIEGRIGQSGKPVKEIHAAEIAGSSIGLSSYAVELAPGETKTITVHLDAGLAQDQFAEGYIYFKSLTEGQADLSMPYFGFVGDWSKEKMVDAPAWESDSKTKLTAVLSTYKHSKDGESRYIELGRRDISDAKAGIQPEYIAIQNKHTDSHTSHAYLRFALLRDVVAYDLDIVGEAGPDSAVLKRIDTGTMLTRLRYADYFEDIGVWKQANSPIELHQWDGNLLDAKTQERLPAPDGQYYFRLRVKNKAEGDYQYTYLPVKIDNQKPEFVSIDMSALAEKKEIEVQARDNLHVWNLRASLDGKEVIVQRVTDSEGLVTYKLQDISLNPLTDNQLLLELMDSAGNVVIDQRSLQASIVTFDNLTELLTPKALEDGVLKGKLGDATYDLIFRLDGKQVPVARQGVQWTVDIQELSQGSHEVEFEVVDAQGRQLCQKKEIFVKKDRYTSLLDYQVSLEDEDEDLLEVDGNGRFLIKGKLSETVVPESVKLFYIDLDSYGKSQFGQKATRKELALKPDGRFEQVFFKSDFPRGIVLELKDSRGKELELKRFNLEQVDWTDDEDHKSTITILNYLLDTNKLNAGNIGRETDSGLVDFKQAEDGSYIFTFEMKKNRDKAHSVRINGQEARLFEGEELMHYPLKLDEGSNSLDLAVYGEDGKLLYRRNYRILVDLEEPELELQTYVEKKAAGDQKEIDGYLYANAAGQVHLKGLVGDKGEYWSLVVNDNFIARGGFFGQYGDNEQAFSYLLENLKAGDLIKMEASDNFANVSTKIFEVIEDKEAPLIAIQGLVGQAVYEEGVLPVISVTDAVGIADVTYLLDGQTYRPGQEIVTPGEHVLRILAEDHAGNKVEKELRFSIAGAIVQKGQADKAPKSPKLGLVRVLYLYKDEKNRLLDSQEAVLAGLIGESYRTDRRQVSGYFLDDIQGLEEGEFTDAVASVTYHYKKVNVDRETSRLDGAGEDQVGGTALSLTPQREKNDPDLIKVGQADDKTTTKSPSSSARLPQTGQAESLLLYVGLLAISLLGGVKLAGKRKD